MLDGANASWATGKPLLSESSSRSAREFVAPLSGNGGDGAVQALGQGEGGGGGRPEPKHLWSMQRFVQSTPMHMLSSVCACAALCNGERLGGHACGCRQWVCVRADCAVRMHRRVIHSCRRLLHTRIMCMRTGLFGTGPWIASGMWPFCPCWESGLQTSTARRLRKNKNVDNESKTFRELRKEMRPS